MNNVEYRKEHIFVATSDAVEDLKNKANRNSLKKYRYCFHQKDATGLQEMMFASSKKDYLRPHMHKNNAETQILLDGRMVVLIFDESGKIKNMILLESDKTLLYRIDKGLYHMNIPLSEQIVLYELRDGGFSSETNLFPAWAPEPDDKESISRFRQKIEKVITNNKFL